VSRIEGSKVHKKKTRDLARAAIDARLTNLLAARDFITHRPRSANSAAREGNNRESRAMTETDETTRPATESTRDRTRDTIESISIGEIETNKSMRINLTGRGGELSGDEFPRRKLDLTVPNN